MTDIFDKISNYLILIGFVLFSAGSIFSLLYWFKSYDTPFELQLASLGLLLLFLGLLAAKIFAEVKFFERNGMG
jgi:uncharacterized membrane protein